MLSALATPAAVFILVGGVGFILATLIDHGLGIACYTVSEIGVKSRDLFLHKFMYFAIGAFAMYLAIG